MSGAVGCIEEVVAVSAALSQALGYALLPWNKVVMDAVCTLIPYYPVLFAGRGAFVISIVDPKWMLFVQLAELGSLARTALTLDVPQSMVSRHLAQLEQDCGALASGEGGAGSNRANNKVCLLDLLSAGRDGAALLLEALECRLVEEVVAHTQGNLAAAARMLWLSRAQLAYRLQKG